VGTCASLGKRQHSPLRRTEVNYDMAEDERDFPLSDFVGV
jgi:hypothetical protein